MYYKTNDKNSKIYKSLYELRSNELQIEKENKKKVIELVGNDWDGFVGYRGQQNLFRVTIYEGFCFNHPENLPPKTFIINEAYPENVYVPNKRTKAGRRISDELNKLSRSSVNKVFHAFGINPIGRFKFPFVEICDNGVVVVYMDDEFSLDHIDGLVEITSKEFYDLLVK